MKIKDKFKEKRDRAVRALVKKLMPGYHVQKNTPKGPKPRKSNAASDGSLI